MVRLYVSLIGVRRRQQWCVVCWGSHYFLTILQYLLTLIRYPISFATVDSVFGPVPSTSFLGWVHCTGAEESLLDCEYSRRTECSDGKGSGVICQGRAGY